MATKTTTRAKKKPAAGTAAPTEAPLACNAALIVGELVTEPEVRTLPGGTVLMQFSLTVRRPGVRTTSVPLIWFDPPPRASSWELGMHIAASGPVVRRFYKAGGSTGARVEVQVEHADIATRRAATRRVAQAVAGPVSDVLEAVKA